MLLDQFSGKEEYHRVDEGEQRNDQRPCVFLVTVLVTLMGVKHKVSLIRLNFPSRGKTSNKVAMEVTKHKSLTVRSSQMSAASTKTTKEVIVTPSDERNEHPEVVPTDSSQEHLTEHPKQQQRNASGKRYSRIEKRNKTILV